jgi:polysaccharide biosynthesis protein PslH
MKQNILIVCSQSPYPTFHGGAFDVFERIKGIRNLGHNIDLVIVSKTNILQNHLDEIKKYSDKVYLVKRENKISDLISLKPLQYNSRKKIQNITFETTYDKIILESEYLFSIINNKTLKYNKLIVRIHNNEFQYFKQLAKSTSNILKKLYYYSDAFKTKFLTESVLKKADKLWYISNKELSGSLYINKAIWMPPPINSTFKKNNKINNTLLFVGSLFMDNNVQGLDWFISNVHPILINKYENYKLIIVGGTGDLDKSLVINKYSKYDKVELYLNQQNIDSFYEQATAFINPMFFGSGVKLKSINAIVNGLPLISTEIGAEGIGLIENKMFLKANNTDEFLNAVDFLFNISHCDREMIIENAQKYLKANHYTNILKKELNEH